MRITAFLLLIATQSVVSAGGFAQRITLSEKNAPLKKVFAAIKKQTGYTFVYPEDLLQTARPVNVDIKNGTLEQALEMCFSNQPFFYTIIQQTIIVKEKEAPRQIAEPAYMPPVAIKGVVTSENGPVVGANVVIKRTGKGTVTAANGQFSLPDVNDDDILVITSIGFQRQEVPVKGTKGFVYVQLKIAVDKLDEIQVLAYGGATTRRLSTGSVSKVTSEEISRNPVGNVLLALDGRVTGLSISQANGLAGGDVFFEVRGRNSLNADNYTSAPLVIIDGVPYPNTPISHKSVTGTDNMVVSSSPNGYGSPLYNINPRDIESVEILKDADATAIYGSRAANGVLLITTKKGKPGKTKFDVGVNTGVTLDARRIDLLTTPEYLALRREAFRNAGITPTATYAFDLLKWDTTSNTDWQKEMLGHTAQTTAVNVSMSGGAGGTTFLVSGNYSTVNTIFPDRRASNKAGAHVSLTHTSGNGRFHMNLSGLVGTTNTKYPGGNYGVVAFSLPPNWQAYDAAGNLNWQWNDNNPYAIMKTAYSNSSLSVTSNLGLGYTILTGLNANVGIGYTRAQNDQQYISPKAASSPGYFQRSYNYSNTASSQTLNVEPNLQYTCNVGGGNLNVLAGGTIMKNMGGMPLQVIADDFVSDAYLNILSLARSYQASNGYTAYQYASFFGRANYNWDNKYILNGSFRRDGSSKFGADNRFGNFGAIGAAWLFSSEGFARKLSLLSSGKLRGSIGWVGSDNVGNYKFLSTYSPIPFQTPGSPGMAPTQLDNPNFSWESSGKLEGGLDLGFFKDRILVSASWYRNRAGNQLVDYPVSTQTGFTSYTANLTAAVVQNTGWEFELNTTNVQTKNFKWSTSFNLSLGRNKLLKFDGIEQTPYAGSMVVGESLNSLFAIHYTGADAAGMPTFLDANKNGRVDLFGLASYGRGDLVYVGKSTPAAIGGMGSSLSWKHFQLHLQFSYRVGQKMKSFLSAIPQPGGITNVPRKAVESIRALGLDKGFIQPYFSYNWYYYTASDATYMDASYVRLNNLSFSYMLAGNALKKLHLAGASVYLQAQNLFVISNYNGYDPETGPMAIPPLLTVTGGIQCSF